MDAELSTAISGPKFKVIMLDDNGEQHDLLAYSVSPGSTGGFTWIQLNQQGTDYDWIHNSDIVIIQRREAGFGATT